MEDIKNGNKILIISIERNEEDLGIENKIIYLAEVGACARLL
jgi:hypothetical protein